MRKPFDDGGFSNAGFADQHRIVLAPTTEDLQDSLNFIGTTDHGIQLTFLGQLSQITAEFIESRSIALRSRSRGADFRRNVTVNCRAVNRFAPKTAEDFSPYPFFFTKKAEEKMLAADVVVAK